MINSTASAGMFLSTPHAILLGFPVAFSSAAVAADVTYLNSEVMQWSNFAAWLITGTAMFGAVVLVWAIVATIRAGSAGRRGRAVTYLVLIAAMWLLSVVNSLHHARDAWGSVGASGLVLSTLTALLALGAALAGHWPLRSRPMP